MDASAVVTDRCADIGLERSTKGEVAADAETYDPDFSSGDLRVFGKPVQTSTAIGIEMRDRSLRGILLAADPSSVIEWDHRSRGFEAAIDFRGSGNKSIPGQPYAGAQHWGCELKNVGIGPDARVLALRLRRSHEGSHRETMQSNVHVFGFDDHLLVCAKF